MKKMDISKTRNLNFTPVDLHFNLVLGNPVTVVKTDRLQWSDSHGNRMHSLCRTFIKKFCLLHKDRIKKPFKMICSKSDYNNYRKQDGTFNRTLREVFFDEISQFKVLLRKTEYFENCKTTFCGKFVSLFYQARFHCFSRRLGFTIPINVFGPGLSIPHPGTIVVHSAARVGSNCRLHVCVIIGASSGSSQAPRIGNNVYIGPGAKIFGDIEIADGIAIGANSVVNRSFLQQGITIAGIPAKQIGEGGSGGAGWNPN